MTKMNIKRNKNLAISMVFFILAAIGGIYLYKCYTDPLYYKTEVFEGRNCEVLKKYIPDGSSREYVEKILIDSDGARIKPNNPNSKGSDVGSVIYNLDPWVIFSNDASYIYVWYENDKVIGLDGQNCGHDRYPASRRAHLEQLLKIGKGKSE